MTLNITIWTKDVLIITAHNTDGLVNCLLQPGHLHLDEKHFTT